MPDLGQFAIAWILSAAVAAALVAATAGLFRRAGPATGRAAALFAVVAGAVTGFFRLADRPRIPYSEAVDRLAAAVLPAATAAEVSAFLASLPSAGAVDRLLWIVLPAAVAVEAVAAVPQIGRGFIWVLRAMVAAGLTPVLLWGSVYVSGPRREWSGGETAGVYVGIGAAAFGVWLLLALGNRRTTGVAAAATTVSLEAAGIVMFCALYLGGGKASLPLAGALVGALAGALLVSRAYADPAARTAQGDTLLGLAVVGLAGLLVAGRFFSRVTTWEGVVLAAAPLLTLVGELPLVRKQRPWIVATVKLALAAVPPAIVAYLAKRAFDQDADLLM